MSTDCNLTAAHPRGTAHHHPLVARGFTPDGATYRRGDLQFAIGGGWCRLRETAGQQPDFPWPPSPAPVALWKWVRNGPAAERVFEVPSWAVREEPDDDRFDADDRVALGLCLDWALATRSGRVPESWRPPARELVESWLPPGALTVQTDGLVRQGEMILQPDCWTMRIPLLPELPARLPETRAHALRELTRDAQSLWGMLRLALTESTGSRALFAEVDLSGAPPSEVLFAAGLDVLRQAAVRLIETAEALADDSLPLASLTIHR